MKNPITITVNGSFGEKEIDKAEFIKQWSDHMQQLSRLSWYHSEEFKCMQDRVCEIADIEFDRIQGNES